MAPPRFDAATPLRRDDGGYRRADPAATARRLSPLVSDLTGLLAAEHPLPAGPGRHVHAAAFLALPADPSPPADAFQGIALGKGRSPEQARTSALAEAVERLSARWHDGAVARHASLRQMGPDAIAPDALWQFSARQYAMRAEINARTPDPRRHVPPPLSPDDVIAWSPCWSLTHLAWRWVPREHLWANAPGPRHGRYNPNGCAAGTTLDEAVLQGFLELVERDAVAIWWYNRCPRPAPAGGIPDHPALHPLIEGIAARGWRVWLLDLTTDLGIPVTAALARAETDGRWCIGFGAHFEAEIAAERALTELAQLFRVDGRDGPPPWAPDRGADEAYLYPSGTVAPPPPPLAGTAETFGELVEWCAALVAARGMEMLVTDLTHPDIALPVAKVSVPGLRHFWPRFAPGRLYDVPVAMGWRESPRKEEALNPVPLFV